MSKLLTAMILGAAQGAAEQLGYKDIHAMIDDFDSFMCEHDWVNGVCSKCTCPQYVPNPTSSGEGK